MDRCTEPPVRLLLASKKKACLNCCTEVTFCLFRSFVRWLVGSCLPQSSPVVGGRTTTARTSTSQSVSALKITPAVERLPSSPTFFFTLFVLSFTLFLSQSVPSGQVQPWFTTVVNSHCSRVNLTNNITMRNGDLSTEE